MSLSLGLSHAEVIIWDMQGAVQEDFNLKLKITVE